MFALRGGFVEKAFAAEPVQDAVRDRRRNAG